VFNIFLQVFEDGRLTDGKGRTVDCRDAIFIMTSNVGSDQPELFGAQVEGAAADEQLREVLLRHFSPEFLNRIDEIVIFRPLDREHIRQIARLMVGQVEELLEQQDMRLHMTEGALDMLAEQGYDARFGARPMRRAVERLLIRPLSDLILGGQIQPGHLIVVTAGQSGLIFEDAGAYTNEAQGDDR
jgi:ATP-dependent Clp protease ATP-binding subunit ClpA